MSLESSITIRINEYERLELEKRAKEYKLTLSEYIRLKLLTTKDIPIAPIVKINRDEYFLLAEINQKLVGVGTNINQLARNANLSINMGSPMQLQLLSLNEIKDLIDELVSEITKIRLDMNRQMKQSYDR
jgi:uncharacterized small protein (DUF1192 family)